jgi:UDP-glucose 4-epimerase
MSDTLLITGALGYLGGRIAQDLAVQTGYELRLASRRPPPTRPEWLPRGTLVPLDVADAAACENGCRGADAVVHLAALNEIECAADPVAAAVVNGAGTWRLLHAAVRQGVKKFIFFSTAHVYGAPLAGVITEQTLPRPAHPYASSHHFGEDAVLEAHDKGRLTGIVLRLSNGAGAPACAEVNRWTLVGNDLCRQAVRDRRLVLHSSGLARRDFIPLSDVCCAVRHVLAMDRAACGDGLFNLGAGHSMRVLDMAELVAVCCEKALGFRPPIERPAPAPGESHPPLEYRIEKLRAAGYQPIDDMPGEIAATLRLCREAFLTPDT